MPTSILGLTTFVGSDTIDLVTHVSTGIAQRTEDIFTGAAAPAGSLTVAWGTITVDRGLKLTGTLNAAGVTFVPLDLNITFTAAAAASRLARVRQDSNAIFEVAAVSGAATGITITPAAAGSRASLAAISTGANEGLDFDAKGSGIVTLGRTSTGGVAINQGNLLIGTGVSAPQAGVALTIVGSMLATAATQNDIACQATMSSAATTAGRAIYIQLTTAAAAFTMTNADGIYIDTPSKGAGSTITTGRGLYVNAQTAGGTNNYGVYIEAPSGGSAENAALRIGGGTPAIQIDTATGAAAAAFAIGFNATYALTSTSTSQWGMYLDFRGSSSGTTNLIGLQINCNTAAAVYTVTDAQPLRINNPSKGAGSTITTNRGIYVNAQTAGGTNNYGVYIEAPSGGATQNAGIYVAGGGVIVLGEPTVGVASSVAITGTSDITANSTGVGTIKFKGATARDSTGFFKVFVGTTAYFVPFFSAITG